jgi:TLD
LNEVQYIELMSLCEFKTQKWKLLYRGSRDGFRAVDFHDKCDNVSNTLTVIKTTDTCIFGGYTGASWSKFHGFKDDQYSFVFSYINKTNEPLVIECTETSNAIYCHESYGPCFGNDDIKIANMSNTSTESESIIGFTYGDDIFEYRSEESKTFLAGSQYFTTEEIEVYCKDYKSLTQVKNELNEMGKASEKDMTVIIEAYDKWQLMER